MDIVQLRQKGLEAGQELRYLEVFRQACAAHGALLAVNDRADVAYAAGADVLHLGQDDLPAAASRARSSDRGPLIGLSSHAEAETLAASAEPAADYFCTGPGLADADQARAGRAGPGPGPVRGGACGRRGRGSPSAASTRAIWIRCWTAGATRIVVVRVLTEAEIPARPPPGWPPACADPGAGAGADRSPGADAGRPPGRRRPPAWPR